MDFDAQSITEFCRRHGLCRATFYNLKKRDEAPAVMKVGSRVLVTAEAAAAWRRKMEAATSQSHAA
jgi:predicted DNA-binding transcriptional regulator AlpA